MNHVILQPSGGADAKKHYADTIEKRVPLSRIEPFVTPAVRDELRQIYPQGGALVWGVTPGSSGANVGKWNRIRPGDVTLFVMDNRIVASAVTTVKTHNEALALDLWGRDDDGATWEYVYFLDELRKLDIPVPRLNKAVGYAEKNVVRGFNVLDETKSLRVLEAFDLRSETYVPEITEEEYGDAINRPDFGDDLDITTTVKARKEQGFLRQNLFGKKKTATCGICGHELPVNLLVTAHIKKRSQCSLEELMDYDHIVMPMCKLGCDDLYEKGYLFVEDGVITDGQRHGSTDAVRRYLDGIVGRSCAHWSDSTAPYFRWHSDHMSPQDGSRH